MKKIIEINQKKYEVDNLIVNKKRVSFSFAGQDYSYEYTCAGALVELIDQGHKYDYLISRQGQGPECFVALTGQTLSIAPPQARIRKGGQDLEGQLTSPMPGKVLKYLVRLGDAVELGQPVAILEAMKMEHTLKSPINGVVEKIIFQDGAQVKDGQELLQIKEIGK